MQNPKFAAHVHKIICAGLDLIERLERAARTGRTGDVNFTVEHGKMLSALTRAGDLAGNADYAGDGPYLGARYALACWLDEVFMAPTSVWQRPWAAASLEVAVVGKGAPERAWRFWRQAKLEAKDPARTDAHEVYLWCFALGFRGTPEKEGVSDPHEWMRELRGELAKAFQEQQFPYQEGRTLTRKITVLKGRAAFRRMTKILIFSALAAGIAGAYHLLKL